MQRKKQQRSSATLRGRGAVGKGRETYGGSLSDAAFSVPKALCFSSARFITYKTAKYALLFLGRPALQQYATHAEGSDSSPYA